MIKYVEHYTNVDVINTDDNVQTCRTCNSSFKSLNLMEYCQSCIADRLATISTLSNIYYKFEIALQK